MSLHQDEIIPSVIESRYRSLQEKQWGTWLRIFCVLAPLLPAYFVGDKISSTGWLEVYVGALITFQLGLIATLPDILAPKLAEKDVAPARRDGLFDAIHLRPSTEQPVTVWVNERFSYVSSFSPREIKVIDFEKCVEVRACLSEFRKLFPITEGLERDPRITPLQRRRGIEIARRAFCLTAVGDTKGRDSFRTLSVEQIVEKIVENLVARSSN